ncbi:hypothetical protein IQ225_07670, partial [Synechocystis salina LEGE 06155]|nr:hypothetical protein [Synechocystis salina LEGE 06155]
MKAMQDLGAGTKMNNKIDIFNNLYDIFPPQRNTVEISENYSSFCIKYIIEINGLSLEKLYANFLQFPERDEWFLRIIIGGNDPVTIKSNNDNINEFKENISEKIKYFDNEDGLIKLELSIKKILENGHISIYVFNEFCSFLDGLSPIKFLDIISKDLETNTYLYFEFVSSDNKKYKSQHIGIGIKPVNDDSNNTGRLSNKVKQNCHFINFSQYPYLPSYFYLVERPSENDIITNLFDKLAVVFLIASIYDVVTIHERNNLTFKLNGYKTIEGNLDIKNKNTPNESINTYFKIYDWIYSESGSVTDKIGLVRNILSLYIDSNSIEIDDDVYFSIQSGFKVYLKENLNKYIEIRGKISEQLLALSQKAGQILDTYFSNFQKSISAFITFFISVFLVRVLSSGNFIDTFTKDATIIAFFLIYISLIYMIYSLRILNKERERLSHKYVMLKERFQDLLVMQDIEKILNKDK